MLHVILRCSVSEENILWFDVAVQEPLIMDEAEAWEHLTEEPQVKIHVWGLASMKLDESIQVSGWKYKKLGNLPEQYSRIMTKDLPSGLPRVGPWMTGKSNSKDSRYFTMFEWSNYFRCSGSFLVN